MDRKFQLAIQVKSDWDGLDLIANLLFIAYIMNYECLPKFRPPTLNPYDGTEDTLNHVQSFKSYMIFLGVLDEIMCRSFLSH